jgi:serine/threonine protein kinase
MASGGSHETGGLEDTLSVRPDPRLESPHPPESRRIGPYRLVQLIGEGGMGEVWVADQFEPVRRRVAVKVIKAGMDTKQVVARFEAERQALALMDHPAIAKVLDAGATPEGRPYFVMEYVPGVSITAHCDTHRLTTEERLTLLMQVCEGVQHAHQKAIIHRDLKPSNILVSLIDGQPQPKIIDFGIAKATGQRLTEKTLFTELGAVIGTPEYMSPEQADLTGQDIDTRTDVYSLGAILYQLLTGELPFGSADLRSSSYEELRRKLREVDPPRPSVRLAALGQGAEEAARARATDPGSLRRQLSGDLDAIVMKALEKERSRRYGTAADLAADLERHLRLVPVHARPATQRYKLKRYLQRHRGLVLALGAVLLALSAGLLGTLISLRSARRAREEEARQRWLAESRLKAATRYFESVALEVAPQVSNLIGATEQSLNLTRAGAKLLDELAVGTGDDPQLRWRTAFVLNALASLEGDQFAANTLGNYERALEHGRAARRLLDSLPADFHPRYADALDGADLTIAGALVGLGRPHEALRLVEEIRSRQEASGRRPLSGEYAVLLSEVGRHSEALALEEVHASRVLAALAGEQDERTAPVETLGRATSAHWHLAQELNALGRGPEALSHLKEANRLAKLTAERWPDNVWAAQWVPQITVDTGVATIRSGQRLEGSALVQRGLTSFEHLVHRDPANGIVKERFLDALVLAGRTYRDVATTHGLQPSLRRRFQGLARDTSTRCQTLLENTALAERVGRQRGRVDCGPESSPALHVKP